MRELLTATSTLARTSIERYGGTVEKFIGDAVMAVWGAPVAHEDDAERAVRAALDLVAAVPELDAGAPGAGRRAHRRGRGHGRRRRARAWSPATSSTPRRAPVGRRPGTVLVGEATRRASEAAIAYEDAGDARAQGQGRAGPAWRALRVVAASGGARDASSGSRRRSSAATRELRLVKDLFHATRRGRRAPRLGHRRRRASASPGSRGSS